MVQDVLQTVDNYTAVQEIPRFTDPSSKKIWT